MMQTRPIDRALAALLVIAWGCDRPTALEEGARASDPVFSIQSLNWGPAQSVDPGGVKKINTAALDGCPIESPDGRSLFFATNRDGQIDIWSSERTGPNGEWSEPEKLPEPVNSPAADFCPTPLEGGRLLFVSTRAGGCGMTGADIYEARLHPTRGWIDFENLGCVVNSAASEFSPSYVGAGGGMLFFSSSLGGKDNIYVSHRQPGGAWGEPVAVAELNLAGWNTVRPNVSQDGRVIVFDSDRASVFGGANIWMATRPNINVPWSEPVPLGFHVNSDANETRGSLSRAGKRLYFGSNRAGEGDSDIFVVTRE